MVEPIHNDHDTHGPLNLETAPTRDLTVPRILDPLAAPELPGETRNHVVSIVVVDIRTDGVNGRASATTTDNGMLQD